MTLSVSDKICALTRESNLKPNEQIREQVNNLTEVHFHGQ